jgi:hypothetical protein
MIPKKNPLEEYNDKGFFFGIKMHYKVTITILVNLKTS